MFYVDLNSDLGESFGNYTIGMDEEILQYVSSANVPVDGMQVIRWLWIRPSHWQRNTEPQ